MLLNSANETTRLKCKNLIDDMAALLEHAPDSFLPVEDIFTELGVAVSTLQWGLKVCFILIKSFYNLNETTVCKNKLLFATNQLPI